MKSKLSFSKFYLIIIFFILLGLDQLYSQAAYEHVNNKPLYSFLDEMSAIHLIELNSAIKPYSRMQIAEWLLVINSESESLTSSQQYRLEIFMREFMLEIGTLKTGKLNLFKKSDSLSLHLFPPEFSWCDSGFKTLVRPVYGLRYFIYGNETFYHSYGGGEFLSYLGKNWSIYASVRDNYQNKYVLAKQKYFTQELGGNYKINEGGRKGGDYSEMRGGITYGGKWGTVGLVKDHLEWGDNYNGSNILSGRTPSFALLKLNLKPVDWLEFNYFHGWLVSEVIDSAASYVTLGGHFRAKFRDKYIASNMYTLKPFKNFHFSVGNAIVYSDLNPHPAYFIPFSFFKSIDHTINRGIQNQNSMMFLNISSRQIKHLHLFYTLYIDELSKKRIFDPERHNFLSYKGGFSLNNWPLKNIVLKCEYTRNYPNTFEHHIETTTFESNKFNLGHYLRGNSQDFFASMTFYPYKSLSLNFNYLYAMHGHDYPYSHSLPIPVDRFPVLEKKSWDRESLNFRCQLNPFANTSFFAEYSYTVIKGYELDDNSAQFYLDKFSPEFMHGKTNGLCLGFNYGF